jgi:hypothetical protein
MTKYTTIRARGFSGYGVETLSVCVDDDGTVRVYDSVAGHYTTLHSLSAQAVGRAKARIRRGDTDRPVA